MSNCQKENCIHFKVCEVKNYNYACPYFEPERPKGEWIEYQDENLDTYYECSICREPWTTIEGTPWQNMMNFCPNCGADMRKGGAKNEKTDK